MKSCNCQETCFRQDVCSWLIPPFSHAPSTHTQTHTHTHTHTHCDTGKKREGDYSQASQLNIDQDEGPRRPESATIYLLQRRKQSGTQRDSLSQKIGRTALNACLNNSTGSTGSLPSKTRSLRQIAAEIHPNVPQNLCHTVSLWYRPQSQRHKQDGPQQGHLRERVAKRNVE